MSELIFLEITQGTWDKVQTWIENVLKKYNIDVTIKRTTHYYATFTINGKTIKTAIPFSYPSFIILSNEKDNEFCFVKNPADDDNANIAFFTDIENKSLSTSVKWINNEGSSAASNITLTSQIPINTSFTIPLIPLTDTEIFLNTLFVRDGVSNTAKASNLYYCYNILTPGTKFKQGNNTYYAINKFILCKFNGQKIIHEVC